MTHKSLVDGWYLDTNDWVQHVLGENRGWISTGPGPIYYECMEIKIKEGRTKTLVIPKEYLL